MKLSSFLAVISTLLWLPLVAQEKLAEKDSLSTKKETIEVLRGNCDDRSTGCINVSLSFPVLEGGNPRIRRQINEAIYTELIQLFRLQLEPLAPDKPGLKLALQEFIGDWESQGKNSNWLVLADGQVAYQTNRVLVISLNSRIVTDEMVPEDRISALNFDLKTGKQILLSNIVSDSLAFKTLVIEKLQTSYPEVLELFDPNDPTSFPLPENFELRSTGIFLWFNEMDSPLLPHGPVSIYLNYEELEDVIRREKYF